MPIRKSSLFVASLCLFSVVLSLQSDPALRGLLRGQVVKDDGRPLPNTTIRLVSFSSVTTTPQGDFQIPVPFLLQPGDPVTLAVDGWEVKDPYQTVPGGMFLPKQLNTALRVVVIPRTVSALQDPKLIQSILEHYGHSPVRVGSRPDFPRFIALNARRFNADPKQMQEAVNSWAEKNTGKAYPSGLYQLSLGHWRDAAKLLRDSSSTPALVASGLAEYLIENYGAAESQWSKANQTQPSDPIVLNNLAITEVRLKRVDRAKPLFDHALQIAERTGKKATLALIQENQNLIAAGKM